MTMISAFVPLALLASANVPRSISPAAASRQETTWTQAKLESVAEEIKADIEKLRGEKFAKPIAVKIETKEGFAKYARDRELEMTPKEQMDADEVVGKMLGVLPPDMNLFDTELAFLGEQVGGFYDPTTKSFCLMDGFPMGVARVILAHELDHALDDQLFDIDGKMKQLSDDSDAMLAYRSVVEGTGTNVMTQWLLKHMKEVDLSGMASFQEQSNRSMAAAPLWMSMPALAAYLAGSAFLVRSDSVMKGQMQAAKNDDIRRAFTDVPRSTEQILHPEKYWDEAKKDEPRRVTFDVSKLPSGWKVLRQDTLGEFALALLAKPDAERKPPDFSNAMGIVGMELTNEIAEGWGGDRLILLGKDEARLLVLATCWDTPRDAAEFYGAMRALEPQITRAAKALVDTEKFGKHATSGVTIEYDGATGDEVKIRVQCGVAKSELEKVEKALTCRCDAAKSR